MDMIPTRFEALQRAVQIAGSQESLATICGISQPAVWKWINQAKQVPPEHVLTVESATGVSRHYLRPDIYPIRNSAKLSPMPPAPRRRTRRPAAASELQAATA